MLHFHHHTLPSNSFPPFSSDLLLPSPITLTFPLLTNSLLSHFLCHFSLRLELKRCKGRSWPVPTVSLGDSTNRFLSPVGMIFLKPIKGWLFLELLQIWHKVALITYWSLFSPSSFPSSPFPPSLPPFTDPWQLHVGRSGR